MYMSSRGGGAVYWGVEGADITVGGGGFDRQLTVDITLLILSALFSLSVRTPLFVGIVLFLGQCWVSGYVGSMFLGLPDPHPDLLVINTDPDPNPSISKQK